MTKDNYTLLSQAVNVMSYCLGLTGFLNITFNIYIHGLGCFN